MTGQHWCNPVVNWALGPLCQPHQRENCSWGHWKRLRWQLQPQKKQQVFSLLCSCTGFCCFFQRAAASEPAQAQVSLPGPRTVQPPRPSPLVSSAKAVSCDPNWSRVLLQYGFYSPKPEQRALFLQDIVSNSFSLKLDSISLLHRDLVRQK